MKEIGDKKILCFVIGDRKENELQQIDIWASSTLLTPVDNMAYLPQFIATLESEKSEIERNLFSHEYIFFNHGPTTDDVVASIKITQELARLRFTVNGMVCLVSIATEQLLSIYRATIEHLRSINA